MFIINKPGSFFVIILSLIILVSETLSSCKKKSDEEPVPSSPVFTVNFMDNYINPQLNAIIFISDMQGKLLADTMISGNGTIHIMPESGITIPPKFMVTIATWEPDMHNFRISLNTYYQIPVSEWIFQGHRMDTVGHVTISLKNVPQHDGPVLFSNSGYSNLTLNTNERVNYLYKNPDDLYILINTSSGPRYKWVPDITKGEIYNVDMSETSIPEFQMISFPGSEVYYEVRVYGYHDQNVESPLSCLLNEQLGDGTAVSSVQVNYPPAKFSTFHSIISLVEDWTSSSTYFYWVDGVIPSSFKKIDASVTSFQPAKGMVEFSTNGTYNVSNATWSFTAANFQHFDWSVYAPDSTKTIILPEIPPSIRQMFPVLSLDSLVLDNIQLMNFTGLPTYDDFIYQTLVKNPPVGIEHLETSTVKVLPAK